MEINEDAEVALLVGEGRERLAARAAVLRRSPLFAAMLDAPMRERATGEIVKPNWTPDAARAVLEFLEHERTSIPPALLSDVFAAADEAQVCFASSYP
eukprot:tig00020675_g12692.t1